MTSSSAEPFLTHRVELALLNDGFFKLDGGAMFGIVPKPLWSRCCEPDAANRIRLRAGVLLAKVTDAIILVDTGFGSKLSERQKDIYAFEGSTLLAELAAHGVSPEDVTHVVLTHLHIDHAGGCTRRTDAGKIVPVFPNAQYLVQTREWEAACANHPLTRGSYAPDDFMPLKTHGQLTLLDGNHVLGHGISLFLTGGHSPGHQIAVFESHGQHAVFLGDLVPTAHHLRLPYVMAYDAFPLDVVNEKNTWIQSALNNAWQVFLQHDPDTASGELACKDKTVTLLPKRMGS